MTDSKTNRIKEKKIKKFKTREGCQKKRKKLLRFTKSFKTTETKDVQKRGGQKRLSTTDGRKGRNNARGQGFNKG